MAIAISNCAVLCKKHHQKPLLQSKMIKKETVHCAGCGKRAEK